MGALTYNALTAAELLIIPTQAEYFSAYALRDMMTLIRRARLIPNPLPGLPHPHHPARPAQPAPTRSSANKLEQTFGSGLFQTVIEIDTRLRESPIIGLPITQYRPASRGSQQCRVLAQELIEYVQQQKDLQSAQ